MIGEFDIYGVFVPVLLAWAVIALALTAVLRRCLAVIGFYRLVWHRALVDLSLFVLILAAVSSVMSMWIQS
jgi:protein AaeX